MVRLESAFVQQSDSAVFGKLKREGRLKLAKGGMLRVEYRQGLLLVADGRTLTQYDPDARTAQRMSLRSAAADTPLLNIMLNPAALAGFYRAEGGPGDAVRLEPLREGLPKVELTARAGLLQRIRWTDPTGAEPGDRTERPARSAAVRPGHLHLPGACRDPLAYAEIVTWPRPGRRG